MEQLNTAQQMNNVGQSRPVEAKRNKFAPVYAAFGEVMEKLGHKKAPGLKAVLSLLHDNDNIKLLSTEQVRNAWYRWLSARQSHARCQPSKESGMLGNSRTSRYHSNGSSAGKMGPIVCMQDSKVKASCPFAIAVCNHLHLTPQKKSERARPVANEIQC